jgi:hypothetical protein
MTTTKSPETTESVKVEVKPHAPHAGIKVTEVPSKKKRRYSRGLGTLQHLVRGAARSAETVTAGVARVFSTYNERSDKSARRKRDGALRDGIENWTKAFSKGLQVAGDAPYKFVKEVNRGPGSKQVRDSVRLLTPPPLR